MLHRTRFGSVIARPSVQDGFYTERIVQSWCLALHASYACAHRGECCGAWEVPAERHVIEFVRGRMRRPGKEDPFVFARAESGETQSRIAHSAGACVFRAGNRCEIQADGGEMALPVSCRHFPRVILRDARGTLISLSHYCPTAAALLFAPAASLREVAPGCSLAAGEPIEGLDARDALPPLLRPGMLADIEGYAAWERSVIDTFSESVHAGRALDTVAAVTEEIRRWTPARGALAATVRGAFAAPREPLTRRGDSPELDMIRAMYRGDVPLDGPRRLAGTWDQAVPDDRVDLQRPVANYLAARAFGNWVAYQGHGIRSVVAWLRACYDVLRSVAPAARLGPGALTSSELCEAIRVTDMVMLHSIDSHVFAAAAVPFEKADPA